MLKEFKSFVEKHNLIEKDDRVLLAISGGVDSMVLAKLLLRLQDYKTTRPQVDSVAELVEAPKTKKQQTAFSVQRSAFKISLSLIVTSICVAMTLIAMSNS